MTQRATLNKATDQLPSLGATLGGKDHRCSTFEARLRVLPTIRHKLAIPSDPAVEQKLAKH